jgi:hypothetical protein
MNAVMEHNVQLFNPTEALELEREVIHCAEVARLQLKDLGPADSAKQAAQVHSYKDAILDLNRSRPVFKPCKANARVPLVRSSLLLPRHLLCYASAQHADVFGEGSSVLTLS